MLIENRSDWSRKSVLQTKLKKYQSDTAPSFLSVQLTVMFFSQPNKT